MPFEPSFDSFPDGPTPGGGNFLVAGKLPRAQAHAAVGSYVVSPDGHIQFGEMQRDGATFSFDFSNLPMMTGTASERVAIPYLLVVHAEYGQDTFREVHRILLVDRIHKR